MKGAERLRSDGVMLFLGGSWSLSLQSVAGREGSGTAFWRAGFGYGFCLVALRCFYSVFCILSPFCMGLPCVLGDAGCIRRKRVRWCHVTCGNMQFLGIVVVKSEEDEDSAAFKRLRVTPENIAGQLPTSVELEDFSVWSHDLRRLRQPCCVQFLQRTSK